MHIDVKIEELCAWSCACRWGRARSARWWRWSRGPTHSFLGPGSRTFWNVDKILYQHKNIISAQKIFLFHVLFQPSINMIFISKNKGQRRLPRFDISLFYAFNNQSFLWVVNHVMTWLQWCHGHDVQCVHNVQCGIIIVTLTLWNAPTIDFLTVGSDTLRCVVTQLQYFTRFVECTTFFPNIRKTFIMEIL